MNLDPYKVLKVRRNASAATIRRAHRKRAMETHPDRNGDPEEFHQVTLAWSVLGDPVRRKQYDETGSFAPPQPDNSRNLLAGILYAAFRKVAAQHVQMGRPLAQCQIVTRMKEDLQTQATAVKKNRDELAKAKPQLSDALVRLTDKEGLLLQSIVSEVDGIERQSQALAEQESLFQQALAYLEQCGYKAEQPPVRDWGPGTATSVKVTTCFRGSL